MTNPVVRGFTSLLRFSGRDTRGQFWPYAGVAFFLVFTLCGLAMATVMNSLFSDLQQFAAEHPEAATVYSSPGSYSIQIDAGHPEAPQLDLRAFMGVMAFMVLAIAAALAAAVSRRLHDSGRSARWGLLPLPFLAFGLAFFPVMIGSITANAQPQLGLFFALFFNNLLYLVALGSLIVLLVRPTRAGANRFGPEPGA